MIANLSGKVLSLRGVFAIIDAQGVGYEVRCTQACLATLNQGSNCQVVVFTEVREDAINLYGFADQAEKEVFLLLLKVKGVGARSASEILSNVDKQQLLRAIGSGDVHTLQTVKGVGKKTAERIVVELRDKVADYVNDVIGLGNRIERIGSDSVNDALDALVALGFQRRQAETALGRVVAGGAKQLSSGELVREALRCI